MENKPEKILTLCGVLFLLALGIGFLAGQRVSRGHEAPTVVGEVEVGRDTVRLTDTVFIDKPREASREIVGEMSAVLPVVADSADIDTPGDSATVLLPVERKVYEDSTYRAVVEGFNPSLVSLEIYPTREIVTVTKRQTVMVRPKIAVGPSLSVGYDPLRGRIAPVIGVSVTVPIFVK